MQTRNENRGTTMNYLQIVSLSHYFEKIYLQIWKVYEKWKEDSTKLVLVHYSLINVHRTIFTESIITYKSKTNILLAVNYTYTLLAKSLGQFIFHSIITEKWLQRFRYFNLHTETDSTDCFTIFSCPNTL